MKLVHKYFSVVIMRYQVIGHKQAIKDDITALIFNLGYPYYQTLRIMVYQGFQNSIVITDAIDLNVIHFWDYYFYLTL